MTALGMTNLIDGTWRPAEKTFETRLAVGSDFRVMRASARDAEAAIDAAVQAFRGWAGLPVPKRQKWLNRLADEVEQSIDEIARLESQEVGRTLTRCIDDMKDGIRSLRAASEFVDPSDVARVPVGPVAAFSPWYQPARGLLEKLASILIRGNTAVVKLPEWAPLTGLRIAGCMPSAGSSRGVVNLLTGIGGEVGDVLCGDRRIRAMTMSGTNPGNVDRVQALCSGSGQRIQITLNGINPAYVHDDADIRMAVTLLYASAFENSGQDVQSTSIALVASSVYDAVMEELEELLANAEIGEPTDVATHIGPLVNAAQVETYESFISDFARIAHSTRMFGSEFASGTYVHPCLLEANPNKEVIQALGGLRTVLGPVLVLLRVEGPEEAVGIASKIPGKRVVTVFSLEEQTVDLFVSAGLAPNVYVNADSTKRRAGAICGGWDMAGFGPLEFGSAADQMFSNFVSIHHAESELMGSHSWT